MIGQLIEIFGYLHKFGDASACRHDLLLPLGRANFPKGSSFCSSHIVGLVDGILDFVGLQLGDCDGLDEGLRLGLSLGLLLGDTDGVEVGLAVGDTDGDNVGEADGDKVGLVVGEPDGNNVGLAVGGAVGDEVG